MRDRIPIEKELCPYRFDIDLGENVFVFDVNYNAERDLFTVNLYRNEDEPVCMGEKLTYGQALFADMYRAGVYPVMMLVPWDASSETETCNWDTLGRVVFLEIADTGGDEA